MGVSNSPDTFQSKISQLMVGLDFVRACLDDVLVAIKDSFTDHNTLGTSVRTAR
jgi:hypothetical protein